MELLITNVVFDLDGTLVNSNPASLRSLQQTMRIVENRYYTLNELEDVLGLTDDDVFKKMRVTKKSECYSTWKALSKELDKDKKIFPDILETLNQLRSFGINLGIVTSRERERYLDNHLIMTELDDYFNVIVTSEATVKHKPDPEPLLKWLKLSHSDPSQTIYIGDTKYDYICAKKAGVRFGLAAWGLHQKVENELIFDKPIQIAQMFKVKGGLL